MSKKPLLLLFLYLFVHPCQADVSIRETILLTKEEQTELRHIIKNSEEAQTFWMLINQEAQLLLKDHPRPVRVIYYEGLLDTNPRRRETQKSLEDMDKLALWLFGYYGSEDEAYVKKVKKFVLAWADTYKPTGNPINENKLEPLLHCYHVMKDYFSLPEQKLINNWMSDIAEAEMTNPNIPENNWKGKQIKLVGTIGLILDKHLYVEYAVKAYKAYVDKALYGDGTSRDLHQRDALSYHVSGLDPLLTFAITFDQLESYQKTELFRYTNPNEGSVRKSVEFVIPYATGEKKYAQWVNTKVQLDKQRAEAGLEKYQPGKLFDPKDALDTFELAYYFDRDYKKILKMLTDRVFQNYPTWLALLIDVARMN